MNVMHASMEITDAFYSNLNDEEIQNRISSLGPETTPKRADDDLYELMKEFLNWKSSQRS